MELTEIIKSSIMFFGLVLVILIIFVFVLIKLRNRAKKKKDLFYKSDEHLKIVNFESTKTLDLPNSDILKDKKKHLPKLNYKKFEVINDKIEPAIVKNIHINYHSNVYKYYEEFDSKMMFKLKVESGNHT